MCVCVVLYEFVSRLSKGMEEEGNSSRCQQSEHWQQEQKHGGSAAHGIVTGTTARARGRRPSCSGNGSEGVHRSRRPAFGPVRRRQRTFPSGTAGTTSSHAPRFFPPRRGCWAGLVEIKEEPRASHTNSYTACFLLQGYEFLVLPAVSQDTLGQCSSTSQAPRNDLKPGRVRMRCGAVRCSSQRVLGLLFVQPQ